MSLSRLFSTTPTESFLERHTMPRHESSACMGGLDLGEISDAAIQTIRCVQREILEDVRADPEAAFEPATIGLRTKPLLAIDLVAERRAARELRRKLRHHGLLIVGEESLREQSLDLNREERLVALVDMIDGSDLLQHGLSNWCSAMVFYYPPQQRIVAAFVGLPGEGIYMANWDSGVPLKYRYGGNPRLVPIRGPSKTTTLAHSAIAFYGQKPSCFGPTAGVCNLTNFLEHLNNEFKLKNAARTRIYNLAGNPMMMRMVDGCAASKIDAIFEIRGQAPHDMIPGAYIAQKAGAILCDMEGNSIDLDELVRRPASPHSRIRYVLAATQSLSVELRCSLRGAYTPRMPYSFPERTDQVRARA